MSYLFNLEFNYNNFFKLSHHWDSLLLKYPLKKCGGKKTPLGFCINFILTGSNFGNSVYLNFKMFCKTAHFQKKFVVVTFKKKRKSKILRWWMDYQLYSEDMGHHFGLNAILFLPDSVVSKRPRNYLVSKPLDLENMSGSFRFWFII